MGRNLYADVDTISVHDYERRVAVDVNGAKTLVYEYSTYYEYHVSDTPAANDETIPEPFRGRFVWWYRIYDRATGEVVKSEQGPADSYRAARGAAQLAVAEAMKAYRRN